MSSEKLTMSFSIFGIFDSGEDCVYHDWDKLMKEYTDRGFNSIRLESGQGLLTDLDGNMIEELDFFLPFGKYTKYTRQMDAVTKGGKINIRKRLLEIFRAADKYNVKIVLSSWFIIHTYWFFDAAVTKPILALPMEEKIAHFSKDLNLILDLLKENNLLHCVAFVELFNEMDGIPCPNPPIMSLAAASKKYAAKIRSLHEDAIAMIKSNHPGIKFAYDVSQAFIRTDLIPRNIDVLNFHSYYLWNVYLKFEKNFVNENLNEPELDDEIKQYLNMAITNDDVLDEMKCAHISSCYTFVPRIRIYADIKKDKIAEVEALLESDIKENYDVYLAKMKRNVDKIVEVRDEIVPNAELVMGEGVTYCGSNSLLFEEKSELYWKLIGEQMLYLREKGFLGTVVRTTSGPEDPSWNLCKEKYIKVNNMFLGK